MKGKNSRRALKGQSIFEAIFAGFLIAIAASLFVQYFGINVSPSLFGGILSGVILANFIFLFFIGVPGKLNGTLVIFILLVVLGYAAYGPYSEYLRGPMSDIGESMRTAPGMAEQQLHCLSLLMTDPMSYQTECVVKEQPKAKEEKPENYGFEIIDFKTSTGDIYAGMPIQAQTNFENKGDYDAEDVLIEVTGGEYRECKEEVFNSTGKKIKKPGTIRPGETFNFRFKGKINDPWSEDLQCKYAENKASIGGKLNLNYRYDYQTEAYIDDLRAIRSTNETDPRFEVKSAREKAAPGNVLMFTFAPLISSEKSFQESTIPISFKNERVNGKVIFRGETEKATLTISDTGKEGWCEEFCKYFMEPGCNSENISGCLDAEIISEEYTYCEVAGKEFKDMEEDFCENLRIGYTKKDDESYKDCKGGEYIKNNDEIDSASDCKDQGGTPIYGICGTSGEECYRGCLNSSTAIEIKGMNKASCSKAYGIPMYKVEGEYKRTAVDTITIYIVGDDGKKYVNLSCGEDESEVVKCSPVKGKEDTVELIWKKGSHELGPGEDQFLYSGVVLELVDFPKDENIKEISFGVKADATYRVKMTDSRELTIHNPHYTD